MSALQTWPVPLLLAGGKSTRMGRDKRLMQWGGVPMVRHTYDILHAAFGQPHVLVANADGARELAAVLPTDARFLCDDAPAAGPLCALASALGKVDQNHVFLAACDMPNINIQWLRGLWQNLVNLSPQPLAYVPVASGHPQLTSAFYQRALWPLLEAGRRDGHRSLRDLLNTLDPRLVYFVPFEQSSDVDAFANINTPADYDNSVR